MYTLQTTKNKNSKWKSQKQKYKSPRRKHEVLKNNLNSADSFSKYTKLKTQKKIDKLKYRFKKILILLKT